jgi:hypothetical protein
MRCAEDRVLSGSAADGISGVHVNHLNTRSASAADPGRLGSR